MSDSISDDVLQQLAALIRQRKIEADPNRSYVAQLNHKGLDKILAKITEETLETALAAKTYQIHATDQSSKHLVHELADLWFHVMVLIDHFDLDYQQVLQELHQRSHRSGLEEKRQRTERHPHTKQNTKQTHTDD